MTTVSPPQTPKSNAAPDDLAFLEWLRAWKDQLPTVDFDEVFPDPATGAILVVDLLVGFCRHGPLASDRVDSAVAPSITLLECAHRRGMRRFVLDNDAHTPDTPEFDAWPVHCVRGTAEAAVVPEIAHLPFAADFCVMEKNTLSPGVDPILRRWLEANDDLTEYLVVGDCTDLCVYQMAMYVRMWANATNRQGKSVWVDASAVQTYDLPVSEGAGMPHPGDLLHALFLYHMALNGIRVLKSLRC